MGQSARPQLAISQVWMEIELATVEIDVRAGEVGEHSTATESRCRSFSAPQSRSFLKTVCSPGPKIGVPKASPSKGDQQFESASLQR